MKNSIEFVILGEIFSTKTSLENRIKEILYHYQLEEFLSERDFEFMFEILKLHPEFETKLGIGVKNFFIAQNPQYKNTRNFWILRLDNSTTDFSYKECLKETSHEKRFINACRYAVEPYTMQFKQDFFDHLSGKPYIIPETGESISFNGSHVDHIAPNTFDQLVKDFVKENNIDISQVQINKSGVDNQFNDSFVNRDLERLWIDYHKTHAKLRVTSKRENLTLPKK